MSALAAILERCRTERLTRNQHILFRLGELIAWAETAAIFSERVGEQPTAAINLSAETEKAMARIYAARCGTQGGRRRSPHCRRLDRARCRG